MAKKKNKKKSKPNTAAKPSSSQDATADSGEKDTSEETEGATEETSNALSDRQGTVDAAQTVMSNSEGASKADSDVDVNESVSYVGDIDMSGAASSQDMMDSQDMSKATADDVKGDSQEQYPEANGKEIKENDAINNNDTKEYDNTNQVDESNTSYEETQALITKIESGVKKGATLKSDDPWSSFDSSGNGKKSNSTVLVEEDTGGLLNWVLDRTCCKKRNRAAEL